MVGWYDPAQLARTGLSILISTLFARNSDRRLLEALAAKPIEDYEYVFEDGTERKEIWIDYVADAGDGFDATYAVATAIANDTLEVTDPAGKAHRTQRGRLLVFGGDLVYPAASRDRYERKLVMPYEEALRHSDAPPPHVFALPGNHDWYDSLVAFTRRFCSPRWLGGWRTRQQVSYFAIKLPHDWWLLGTDVQLDSDIDADQVQYFKTIAGRMNDRSRIILCNAEPHWIYQQKYGHDDEPLDSNLQFLEDTVLERKIAVFLAGDLHHYRRHSDDLGHHKIVAGGGGAFLHPTHDTDVDRLPGVTPGHPLTLQCNYPDAATSRALTWRNLLFPILNWRFGAVTAVLYLLTCRAIQADVSGLGLHDIGVAASTVVNAALSGPTALLWVSLLIGGVILFTDTHSPRYRVFGGLSHALAHLTAVFFTGWTASWLVGHWQLRETPSLLATGALVFGGGWLAGSLLMGIYLFVSLNWFGRHANEAFSSLAIPDWKNFLRLHIDERGTLRIYPIGIDRVPRRWQRPKDGGRLVQDDDRATPPRLIESPIVVSPSGWTARRGQ